MRISFIDHVVVSIGSKLVRLFNVHLNYDLCILNSLLIRYDVRE